MTLDELAIKYGSDKSSMGHDYCPFYEKHLPKEPKKILEIGVLNGASLRMWKEYFPSAEIFGLDLFENSVEKKWELENHFDAEYGPTGTKLIMGNQCDHLLLEQLRKYDFDVIIDDGSHNARDQMITFFGLFNGKHYFIEDLHASREPFYSQGLPEELSASYIFGHAKKWNKHMIEEYGQLDTPTPEIYFDNDTKIVCIHAAD